MTSPVDPARLNVGCGEFHADGWVNIDRWRDDQVRPDVQASATALPFADGSARKVYAGHLVEHLDLAEVPRFLVEARRVLRPDGQMMLVGPDMDRMTPGSDEHEQNRLGGCRWPGDEHRWCSSARATTRMAVDAGFDVRPVDLDDVDEDAWPIVSKVWWQFALLCRPSINATIIGA